MDSVFAIVQDDYGGSTKLCVVESREKAEELLPYFTRMTDRNYESCDLSIEEYTITRDFTFADTNQILFRVSIFADQDEIYVRECEYCYDFGAALVRQQIGVIDDQDARDINVYTFAYSEAEAIRNAQDLGLFTRMDEIKAAVPSVIEVVRDAYTRQSVYSSDELHKIIGSDTSYVAYLYFNERVLAKVGEPSEWFDGGWGALEWCGDD